ncbi:copper homeostasis protein CutC [Marinoscillum sp.]|uniref:copper homeostasis protein CutC n=1 Tax=Marinoscillum sp. TaxID=2024838 RepID=UPI003BAD63EF
MPTQLEVCIDSVKSALAAQEGGANRVELCDNLVEGGTTPSAGMIRLVREKIQIGLQVMIRPRGGDFLYTKEEFEVMKLDIQIAKDLGADGVVFGLLNPDGSVDKERCDELIALARPMNITFHRAFDMVKDPIKSLEDLIELGIDRVLTSGLEPDVISGKSMLKKLVEQADGRIIVLAGGGVRLHNVQELIAATGVPEIHVSGRKTQESAMTFRNEKVQMGALASQEYIHKVADEGVIREFVRLIQR